MRATAFDDETLMAFADGELDDETTAAVERAIEADPALAERVAAFMEARTLAREAFAPLLDRPVPDALLASVKACVARGEGSAASPASAKPAEIVDLTARRAAQATAVRPPSARPRPAAANQNRFDFGRLSAPLAASIAVVAAGLIGYMAGNGFGPAEAPQPQEIALIDVPGLDAALSAVPSGEASPLASGAGRFRAIASFRDADDRLCREFELDAASSAYVAVACQADAAWQVAFVVNTPIAEGGYAPASSLETLDSYLDAIGAGAPLSPEDEAALLAGG